MSRISGFTHIFRPARRLLKPAYLCQNSTSQRAPRSSICARGYATSTGPINAALPFAYTWLTKTPQNISPDDVLSTLPSTPPSLPSPDSIPLLLVTPSFSSWLDKNSVFLAQCMSRLYGSCSNVSSSDHFYAVAAVIDKLPDIRAVSQHGVSQEPDSLTTDSSELEGLSLLVVGREDVQGKVAPPRRIRSSSAEEADLVLSVHSEESNQPARRVHHQVGLRLANTIFVNGNETTIFGMRWAWDEAVGLFTLSRSVELTSCVVSPSSASVEPRLRLPLHPVSERRRVISSMGNILRQVAKSPDATSSEPMPASSELEKELPRYIQEHDIVDQRVSVWALVEKPNNTAMEHYGSSTQDRLLQSLAQGGSLHRVMSGGGGWGKKQGLLSLDPEISFAGTAHREGLVALDQLFESKTDAAPELPRFLDKGFVVDDLSLLSQVAVAGDYIQFFVSVEPTGSPSDISGDARSHGGAVTYHFGVVSDTEVPPADGASQGEKDLVLIPGSFGALSEKAIAYSGSGIRGDDISESATKLDVPGARVILASG